MRPSPPNDDADQCVTIGNIRGLCRRVNARPVLRITPNAQESRFCGRLVDHFGLADTGRRQQQEAVLMSHACYLTSSSTTAPAIVVRAVTRTCAKRNPREQARLVKAVVSNSTFDRGSLSPTYVKPFDVFANGGKTGDWLAALDDFRNDLITAP